MAVIVLSPAAAQASPEPSVGTIYFQGMASDTSPAADSINANGVAGNPGAAWSISAAGSGNGPFILLTDASGNVYVADTDNPASGLTAVSVPSTCTGPMSPRMAVDPSGSLIAYWSGDTLYTANFNGSGATSLTTSSSLECSALSWSPAGNWISIEAASGIWVVSPGGPNRGTLVQVDPNGSSPSWSPDGQTIYEVDDAIPFTECDGTVVSNGSDVVSVHVGSAGQVGGITPLHVAYWNCESPDGLVDGYPSQQFIPDEVAVSPDGASLAVYGSYGECDQPDDENPAYIRCGEVNYSYGHEWEIGIVPSSGGPLTQQKAVIGWGPICDTQPPGLPTPGWCLSSTPPTYTGPVASASVTDGLYWASADVYKIIFYVNATVPGTSGHAFVQFRTTSRPGPAIQTYGKYSGYLNCNLGAHTAENLLLGTFNGPGCLVEADGAGPWSNRIIYVVSKSQYDKALAYVHSQQQAPIRQTNGSIVGWVTTTNFQLELNNCMGFALSVAQEAGITLPYGPGGTPYPSGAIPDPMTFNVALNQIGNGNTFDGGLVQSSDGNTANGAPDPTPSPDIGSATSLVDAALGDPATVASTFGVQHDVYSLSAVAIAPGGTVTVSETDVPPQYALYGVDWGDGSTTDFASISPPESSAPSFTHTYADPGIYNERLIVIQGNIEEYDATVSVSGGDASTATQQFTVATPPSSYAWPDWLPTDPAPYWPLAGAPEAPYIGSATAGAGSATVTFSPPFETGDSPITDYTVTASDSTNPSDGGETATGASSPITVTGLSAGDTYSFTVTADNAEGPGLPSDPSNSIEITSGATTSPSVTAGATATYTAGGQPAVLDTSLTVSDPGSADLQSAEVSITSGFDSGDSLNFTNEDGISGTYAAGQLDLSGSASVASYQAALRSITYSFAGSDPTEGGTDPTRTISWQVDDGSSTSPATTSTVDVQLPLTPPTITSADSSTFAQGVASTFTIQTSGNPSGSSMVISESGALPSGVSFSDLDNGTATISGTPKAGTKGTYPIQITASNGVVPPAVQDFTLYVKYVMHLSVAILPSPASVGIPFLATAVLSANGSGGTVSFSASLNSAPPAPIASCQNVPVLLVVSGCVYTPENAGLFTITASYGGNANYAPASGSSSVRALVQTSTGLSFSPSPHKGSKLTVTATVTPTPDAGSVTFLVSGPSGNLSLPSSCSSAALTSGQASCSFTPTQDGDYTVRATYSGSTVYAGSSTTATVKLTH